VGSNAAFSVAIPASCVFTLTYSNASVSQVTPPGRSYFNTPVLQGGNVQFSLIAAAGYTYQIQSSSNLFDWQAVTNIASTNGTIGFTDSNGEVLSERYYRAVQQTN
jgi:hypothetical protein